LFGTDYYRYEKEAPPMTLIAQRVRSLKHRSTSLPVEIDQWITHTIEGGPIEKNRSQLQALQIFMNQLQTRLKTDVERLESIAEKPSADLSRVLQQVEWVDSHIAKTHNVWGFFRNKLEQRFVPHFARSLLAMDLTAYECYRTVMDQAESLGIEHSLLLRDYPLTFFQEEYPSPLTCPRNSMLSRLDYRPLPVPIVGIPWDYQRSTWEFLSLHHEVAHDIDTDLGDLSSQIAELVARELEASNAPNDRIEVWRKWMPEIFADFLGILLGGPAFVGFLSNFLAFPVNYVCGFNPDDEHPTPFLRTLLNVAFVKRLDCGVKASQYVDELSAQWTSIYDQPVKDVLCFCDDFNHVIRNFMDSPLDSLGDENGTRHSISNLITFAEDAFLHQLQVARVFEDGGTVSTTLPLRHIAGAAYTAVQSLTGDDTIKVDAISDAAIDLILSLSTPGQLAIRKKKSTEHIRLLANAYYDA